jgi:adenosyl cobinamide kinase/adenosyl cobinamide phosphate guanylyltransferase
MELIIGGAYQGKLSWAKERFLLSDGDIFDLSLGFPEADFRCFTHLEALTRRAAEDGLNAEEIHIRLSPHIREAIVISREIGCGIVPMDAADREWREVHGALLQRLAKEANGVTRIFCGIPEALK